MKRSLSSNNNGKQKQPKLPPRREATMEDLPDELLGLIFRQLPPWLHRVRVEGVSKRFQRVALAHGWTDIKEFSTETDELYHPTWWGPLLSRVGPHLSTLELGIQFALHNTGRVGEALRVELEKCPRVKHLSVCWELLDPPTALEHIGRAYATTLKSLMIGGGYGAYSTAVRGLSKALSNLSALECMHIYDCTEMLQELHLSARSLANLRHLALYAGDMDCILSEENIDVVVALPRLRSLTLDGYQLSFLQRFPHLEHLAIERIMDEDIESLIEALPHLGRTLKALEIRKYVDSAMSIPLFERLLSALAEHLPLLEHLELKAFYREGDIGEKVHPLLQKGLLDPLASSPRLQNLRSLSLLGDLASLSWAWLEGMSQRLEYLQLGEMPPLATLCSIVENCQNLRELKLDTRGASLSAADRKLLVEALYAPANTTSSDGGKSAVQPKLLPMLHVGFRWFCLSWGEVQKQVNSTTDSRVRFCQDPKELRSHVLDFYKFGCLSEGRPSFIG